MSKLLELKNIGKTVAGRLEDIGLRSKHDLEAMGSARAYRKIQSSYPESHLPLCYYLYSLQGALENRDWRSFSDREKLDMRKQAGLT